MLAIRFFWLLEEASELDEVDVNNVELVNPVVVDVSFSRLRTLRLCRRLSRVFSLLEELGA